jgi:Ca2+-binding RTX toxin-like protein
MNGRLSIALALTVTAWACAAAPAQATVTSGVASGVLTVSSDGADPITVDCQSGVVKINNLNPDAPGGPVACSAITESHVFGGPGSNTITMTNVTAAFFPALVSSEIQGFGDADSVAGSGIADSVTGGTGADDIAGGGGNDVVVWNPGDGSDVIDGEGDSDTVIMNGSASNEIFTVNADGLGVDVLRNLGSIVLDIETTELVVINALAGTDTITSNSLAGTLPTIIAMNGGGDDDELNGSDMGDTLDGGAGTDEVNGNAGNDNLLIRDDTPDTATCGDGTDSITADAQAVDTIAGDCENLDVPQLPQVPQPPPVAAEDTVPPDTQITGSPKAKTKKKQASFSFTSTEPGSTFQCKLDDDPFAACSSPFEDKVKKGKHHFEVRAVDAVGNVDPTPATYDWKVKKPK